MIYSDKFIFVFGSNRAGIHGAGAAFYAREKLGAKLGVGEGITGFCYALPTKDHNIMTLHIEEVAEHIARFVEFAKSNPDIAFNLTPVGCGLAGFNKEDIMKILKRVGVPPNVFFDSRWLGFNGG